MAYRDPKAVHVVTRPHWATKPDGSPSTWTFKRWRYKGDQRQILESAIRTQSKYDVRKAREAERKGEDYVPEVDQETVKDIALARLELMSVSWDGPEFEVPADADDPNAGKLAPLTSEYIDIMVDEEDLESIEKELLKLWGGRSERAQAEFREGPGGLVEGGQRREDSPDPEPEDGLPAAPAS